jgi:hypothetical protein
MVETAAHLCDHVFPRLPVRQWVLSVPKRLRYFMQRDGAVLNMVLRIFLRVIAQSLQDHCAGSDHWTSRKQVLAGVSLRCILDLQKFRVNDSNQPEAGIEGKIANFQCHRLLQTLAICGLAGIP